MARSRRTGRGVDDGDHRRSDDPYHRWKIAAAGFYADHRLPKTGGLLITVAADHQRWLALPEAAF